MMPTLFITGHLAGSCVIILYFKSNYNKLRHIYIELNKHFSLIKYKFLVSGYVSLRRYSNIIFGNNIFYCDI